MVRSDGLCYLFTQQAAFGAHCVGDVIGALLRPVFSQLSTHLRAKLLPSMEGHLFNIALALPLLGPLFLIPGRCWVPYS